MQIAFETGGPGWAVDNGVLAVAVKTTDDDGAIGEDTLHFGVPAGFHAHPDCVGAALSTLCGKKYAKIGFDFPVSDRCRQMIETCYGVALDPAGTVAPREPGDNVVLNFSGGFDSLAALLAGGGDASLLSIDFGPPFDREARYFSTFDTLISKTDIRKKGYSLNDWRFMGSVSLLLADHFNAGFIGFGSTFEASAWHFSPRFINLRPTPKGPFGAIGAAEVSWIRSITEIGTAMVVLALAPDAAESSLKSLAMPGTEKFYRKQLLLDVAARRLGRAGADRASLVKPKARSIWGKATFTVDMMNLFFVREYGRTFVEEWVDLPDDALFDEVVGSDLDFFFKYTPNHLDIIPPAMRNRVLNAFHESGIYPYNEADYASFDRVRRLMGSYYPIG